MQLIDEKIAHLENLDAAPTRRPDFDAFWTKTMNLVRATPLEVRQMAVDYPIRKLDVRDMTFAGLDGTRIHAWIILPPEAAQGPVPAVLCYHGAGGSRGTPAAFTQWTSMGAAVIAHDFRMQSGLTGSNTGFTGSSSPSWFNMGIDAPTDCYLYHVLTDTLRTVEIALALAEIDNARICVNGGSQGGAAALLAAALHPAVTLCMADVPSNCWFEKRIFDRAGGAAQVAQYLKNRPDMLDTVCATLSYFDNINLADRITCPVLISLGLKDPVCPPENVYAAYNKITARKEIAVYPFGEHGGGGMVHNDRKLAFLDRHFFAGD